MKRLLFLAIIVAFIGTILIAGMTLPGTSVADQQVTRKATAVETGTVKSSIKATGNLQPNRTVSLGFQSSDGKVAEVYVVEGQTVVTGTKLARLDTSSLETAIVQAQIDLDRARGELAVTTSKSSADEIASAKAALASAQAAYDVLLAGPSKDEVTAAAADLRTAEVEVQEAQAAYDRVSWKGGVEASSEAAALQTATIAYQKALASYNVAQEPPTDDEVKEAKAQIASAKATLSSLLNGATAEEINLDELDIKAAQASLFGAQQDLERATLTAPFAGTVTSVGIDAGAYTGDSGTGVIDFADLAVLHVDVPVDEIDLPSANLGQPAVVTLDALPKTPLTGKVTHIAPGPTSTDSDTATTYDVTVTLDQQTEGVRTGMTAKVEIETERREGVPVLPTTVVQTDDTGAAFVDKVGPDGQPVRTPITLGLRSGTSIEVLSGLRVGDQVLEPAAVQSAPSAAATSQPQQGGMFGMPGGPPPGGGPPPSGSGSRSSSSGGGR